MIAETAHFQLWVNWQAHEASRHAVEGFEAVTFFTEENYQSNIRLLQQSGFRFID